MPPAARTYHFGPRSTAGIIAGLSGAAAIAAAIAVAASLAVLAFGGGLLLAGAIFILGAVLAFVRITGQTLVDWVLAAGRFLAHTFSPASQRGDHGIALGEARSTPATQASSDLAERDGFGVRTNKPGDYTLCLAMRSNQDFVLLPDDDQDMLLGGWGDFLASFAREGSLVREVQIVERAASVPGSSAFAFLQRQGRLDPAHESEYRELLASLGEQETTHSTFLLFHVATPSGRDPIHSAVTEVVNAERQLANIGVETYRVAATEMRQLERWSLNPDRQAIEQVAALAGKRLADTLPEWRAEHLDWLGCGGSRTRAWEIVEWPRAAVRADWLYPLLACSVIGARTLVVTIRPRSPWKAQREAEQRSTNAASELRRKSQLGFEQHARDQRQIEAVLAVEDELASGHAAVAISGLIAVSCRTREALDQASRDVLDAAGRSRLLLRRLVLRQDQAATVLAFGGAPLRRAIWHHTTTRHAASLWPLQVSGGLGVGGIAIGLDRLAGQTFAYDPFELYVSGEITSPAMVVLGKVGRGKSAFVKAYLRREALIAGRRIWVAGDPKGEYLPLAGDLGLPIISLRPGGTERLNPLDVATGIDTAQVAQQRQGLVAALAAAQLRRALTPTETSAINAVVATLGREATLVDVSTPLLSPPEWLAAELSMTAADLKPCIHDLALELDRLLRGDLKGMFDGASTFDPRATDVGGVVDLSAVYSTQASLVPIMVCAAAWITQQLAGERAAGRKTILVLDEAWQALGATGVTEWVRATIKLARSYGAQVLLVVHRLSDFSALGGDADAVVKQARGILSDAETVFSFAQAEQELEATRSALGLSEREVELLPTLGRGTCLAIVGKHHTLVDVALTAQDLAIADTDAAMRGAVK